MDATDNRIIWNAAFPGNTFVASKLNVVTDQEMNIMRMLAEGYSHKEIGKAFHVTDNKIKRMEMRAHRKLQKAVTHPYTKIEQQEKEIKTLYDRLYPGIFSDKQKRLLATSITNLLLSPRTINILISDEIMVTEDLVVKTAAELLKIPNFGKKSLYQVNECLEEIDFYLGMTITKPSKEQNKC